MSGYELRMISGLPVLQQVQDERAGIKDKFRVAHPATSSGWAEMGCGHPSDRPYKIRRRPIGMQGIRQA